MAKNLIAAFSESSLFLREWLANPLRTGAVAPSSPQLAGAMAEWLPEDPESFVLELGPGTGAVTEALLKYRARIITGDAWRLDDLLPACAPPVHSVGAVISSLPLLNFPPAQAETLAHKIQAVLKPHGNWVQYSYNLGKKQPRGAERFKLRASKIVWLNLPPARVSVYSKNGRA